MFQKYFYMILVPIYYLFLLSTYYYIIYVKSYSSL